jgi:hypothetical protein
MIGADGRCGARDGGAVASWHTNNGAREVAVPVAGGRRPPASSAADRPAPAAQM